MDPGDRVFAHIAGDGDQRAKVISAQTFTTVTAMIFVVFRFWARRVSKTKLSWDDWLMLPSLAFALGYYCLLWIWLAHGFGRPIGDVTLNKLRIGMICGFIAQLMYAYSIALAKFSLLYLYQRVFTCAGQRWIKWYLWILSGIVAIWALAITLLSVLQCRPTEAFWDRQTAGECNVNMNDWFLAVGICNIATDVAMIGLPVLLCSRLQVSSSLNKLLICGVFASGLFVTIISGIRCKIVLEADTFSVGPDYERLNITWNLVDLAMWSSTEVNMAIVSVCLPCLKPLFAKAIPHRFVPASLRKSGSGRGKPARQSMLTISSPLTPSSRSDPWAMYGGAGITQEDIGKCVEIDIEKGQPQDTKSAEAGVVICTQEVSECPSLRDVGNLATAGHNAHVNRD